MRQADCAIRLRQPQQSDLIQRKLFTVHMHVYAAPSYIKRHGEPQSLRGPRQPPHHHLRRKRAGLSADVNWLERAGKPQGQTRVPALADQ